MKPVAVTLLLASIAATAAGQKSPPVFDAHVHAMVSDERWDANLSNPVSGVPLTARNSVDHRRETLRELRRLGVTRAVVSGDWKAVLEWKSEAPELVIASYAFADELPDVSFLRKEHAAGRLEALGEIAVQYIGMAPDDPRLEPYYALAEELDLPIGIHIGPGRRGAAYRGTPKYRMALTDPLALEDVLTKHPRMRLYIMHAAWPRLDDLLGLLYAHPQVYVDVGVIVWNQPAAEFNHFLRRIVDAGYGKRVMFGSDQMVWTDAISLGINRIKSAAFLSESQKRDILFNNAQEFFARRPK